MKESTFRILLIALLLILIVGFFDFSIRFMKVASQMQEALAHLSSQPKSPSMVKSLETALPPIADARDCIDRALSAVAKLEPMSQSENHSLKAGGKTVVGRSDDFLRLRTVEEIRRSNQSCGCGDCAILFADQVRKNGYEVLLIDGAELSISSLISEWSGHAVAAVQDADQERWILVDPTAKRIVDDNWDPESKEFLDHYWIGFIGPAEDYPVHGPDQLRKFYHDTLQSVPDDVWNQKIIGLNIVVDDSMKNPDGSLANPNIPNLIQMISSTLKKRTIEPERTETILLTRGDDDALASIEGKSEKGWICKTGTQAALSPGFIRYLESYLWNHAEKS